MFLMSLYLFIPYLHLGNSETRFWEMGIFCFYVGALWNLHAFLVACDIFFPIFFFNSHCVLFAYAAVLFLFPLVLVLFYFLIVVMVMLICEDVPICSFLLNKWRYFFPYSVLVNVIMCTWSIYVQVPVFFSFLNSCHV